MGAFAGLSAVSTEVQKLTGDVKALANAATAAAAAIRGVQGFEAGQAGALSDLAQGAQKFLPGDANLWAKLIRDIIKNELDAVAAGKQTIGQALSDLQKQLSSFYGAFQQEIADPKTPKEARDFFNQLIQLILSGNLKIDKLAQKVDHGNEAVLDAVHQSGEAVTGGIGASLERYAALGGH